MTVYVGAKEPESIYLVVRTGKSGVDLSLVTQGRFSVRIPDPSGAIATWTCSLSEKTSSAVKLTHTFAAVELDSDVSEIPVAGKYVLIAEIAIAGVWRRCKPKQFVAEDPYGG